MAGTSPSKGVYVEHDLYGVPQRVVEGSPPERGYILIAPGTIATPDDNARVKAARDQLEGATKHRAAAAQEKAAAETAAAEEKAAADRADRLAEEQRAAEKAAEEKAAAEAAAGTGSTPVQVPSRRGGAAR